MAGNNRGVSGEAVIVAFLTGAMIGAVAALLYAPHSGQESRERLRGYARRTEEDFRDLTEKATDAWSTVSRKGREFVQESSAAMKDALDAGKDAMQRERDRYSQEG